MPTFEYVKKSKSQNPCVVMQEKESKNEENPHKKGEEIIPDGLMHELSVGKGLSGTLKLLRDQGYLKETNQWSDRKRGSKTSNLGGIHHDLGQREIIIERRDEFGRVMTAKEAFRELCYKFHGKWPSKTKQAKRKRKIELEMKLKKSSNNAEDAMRFINKILQATQKPYLVINGKKSDMRNSFAAVAKSLPGATHEDDRLVKR